MFCRKAGMGRLWSQSWPRLSRNTGKGFYPDKIEKITTKPQLGPFASNARLRGRKAKIEHQVKRNTRDHLLCNCDGLSDDLGSHKDKLIHHKKFDK